MAEMLPASCVKMEDYGMGELGQDQDMQGYDRKDTNSPSGWGRGKESVKQENGTGYPQGGPLPPFMN